MRDRQDIFVARRLKDEFNLTDWGILVHRQSREIGTRELPLGV